MDMKYRLVQDHCSELGRSSGHVNSPGCRCSSLPPPHHFQLPEKIHILMINDGNCHGGKEFQHNYFVLGYKSLLHIKCSQWVVNQQPETGLARMGGLFGFQGQGLAGVWLAGFFLGLGLGCAGVGFWTAELPACKSIENNLLLLIISERSCAHACGDLGNRSPRRAWARGAYGLGTWQPGNLGSWQVGGRDLPFWPGL